jgi:hypothetical protein
VVRLYFDVTAEDGTVERDSIGVTVVDTFDALHACLDTFADSPSADVERIMVRNEDGDVLMALDLRALLNFRERAS